MRLLGHHGTAGSGTTVYIGGRDVMGEIDALMVHIDTLTSAIAGLTDQPTAAPTTPAPTPLPTAVGIFTLLPPTNAFSVHSPRASVSQGSSGM